MLKVILIGKASHLYNEHITLKEIAKEAEDVFVILEEKIRRFSIHYQDEKKKLTSYLYRPDRFHCYEQCTFDEVRRFSFHADKPKKDADHYWDIGGWEEDYGIIRAMWNFNEEKGIGHLLEQIEKIRLKLESMMCMQSLFCALIDKKKFPFGFVVGAGNGSNTDFENLIAFNICDYLYGKDSLPYLFPYTYSKDFPENWHYGTEEKQTLFFENLLTCEFADYEKDKDWVHYYLQMRESGLVRILEEHFSAIGYTPPKPIL